MAITAGWRGTANRVMLSRDCKLLWSLLIGLFRSRASLEAEILILRQQIIVLRRTAPKRLRFNVLDRLIFVGPQAEHTAGPGWRGKTHTVIVTENGFEYAGKTFPSLTKIAHAITGAHWSGPRFFGLTRKHVSTGQSNSDPTGSLAAEESTHG